MDPSYTEAGARASQPQSHSIAPSASSDRPRRLKSIFSGTAGNLIEWYDWYVYSAFALYFARSFFPAGNQTAQRLNTAAVFAVGFLARPIGGWLMSIYADRHGRRSALLVSVVLMCFGSLIIALCPGYDVIGVAAPALLVVARLLQGLSVGGEYGTSATYLSEVATAKDRGFYSSFPYVTLIAGQLVALALLVILQQFLLTTQQLESWGWRIPFFTGAAAALAAMRLRATMEETGELKKGQIQEGPARHACGIVDGACGARGYIEEALRSADGQVIRAAEQLGLPRKTLYDKITRHGIDPNAFRQVSPPKE